MLAKHPPLLLAFAGGCLSGAALILSGVGAVSIWRGETPASESRQLARAAEDHVAEAHLASVALAAREPTLPTTSIDAEELAREPVTAHTSDDAGSDHAVDSGKSVADVLTRLEVAYRQGLVDGARASASQAASFGSVAPQPGAAGTAPSAASEHYVAAGEAPAGTAAASSPAVAAASPTPGSPPSQPAVIAVPTPPITVAVITPPPAVAAASPAPDLGGSARAPMPAPQQPTPAQDAASVTQNIHIDNLHQGDVYQQLAVMQYLQLFAGSPYAVRAGYTPAPVAPTRHRATPSASPFSTPALPVAAPPFPAFLSSLTNPANPRPNYQRHVGRAIR
jgi:hypothetical protein